MLGVSNLDVKEHVASGAFPRPTRGMFCIKAWANDLG